MSLRALGRRFEKTWLRPLARRLKTLRQPGPYHDRVALLEDRVERLEVLIREQIGLHYLQLADEAAQRAGHGPGPAGRRPTALP